LEDKIKFYLPNVADYLIGTVKDKKNGSFEMELESEIQLIENTPITKIR
jgi:exosome complex RNA-binding protein Rrp4